MGEGLFLIGLGAVFVLIGFLRTASRLIDRTLPKPTGLMRGQEIAAYFVMGLGALLTAIGVVAVIVDLVAG